MQSSWQKIILSLNVLDPQNICTPKVPQKLRASGGTRELRQTTVDSAFHQKLKTERKTERWLSKQSPCLAVVLSFPLHLCCKGTFQKLWHFPSIWESMERNRGHMVRTLTSNLLRLLTARVDTCSLRCICSDGESHQLFHAYHQKTMVLQKVRGYNSGPSTPAQRLILLNDWLPQFITAKSWKQPKCPIMDEWIKKVWFLYMMEYYSAIRKGELETFLGKQTYLVSEINQAHV